MVAWPVVGRDEELGFVVDALRGERTRGVVLAGELGVGKTRLAREAAALVDGDLVVEWLSATAMSAQIPFGALAHLIGEETVRTADDRLRIARGIRAVLRSRAGGRPLVLVVDDAQWLDPGAAALVHQLVVTGTAKVLLTIRTEEPAAEPIVACWKDGWVERLDVQPLSVLEVADLVVSVVGGPVDRVSLQRLWERSKGNPLFLHELVRGALEANAFTRRDGVWIWVAPLCPSGRLVQILESRLARVTPAARKLLDVLAVGEPLPAGVLVDLHGADALVEAERLGLTVVDEREDEVRLNHPLYGEALRVAMGTMARRQVMARLADAMADVAEPPPALRLRVAMWRLDSGTSIPCESLTEAAEIANAMNDHPLAERLARRAVADGGGRRPAMVLGDALNRQGHYAEALTVLDPLVVQARSDADHVAIAMGRYFALTSEYGFRVDFADVVMAAERHVRSPGQLAYLHALRASLLTSAGQLDAGVSLAQQAIEEHPDQVTELRAVSPLVSAWLCSGRADAACAMTERMLEPAVRLREQVPQAPGWVMSLHLPGLVIAGRLDDADEATSAIEAMVTSAGSATSDAAGFIALARGMSSLHRGQVRTACAHLRESVAMLRPFARWRLPFPLVQLAEAAALAGDADGAAAASAEADELVLQHAIFEGVARRARGWVALAQGELSSAVERFLAAAEWSGTHGHHTAELLALHDALRLGEVRRAAAPLQAVAERSEGRWAPAFAMQARALADDDAETMLAAASALEELGALLFAAEAFVQASRLFAGRGSRAHAERSAARAVALGARCEQARSPILEDLQRPLPLTRREREVAGLAARGLSSQAIADRLVVSVRTVEGHLQHAYGKLGVNDRTALASLLPGSRQR